MISPIISASMAGATATAHCYLQGSELRRWRCTLGRPTGMTATPPRAKIWRAVEGLDGADRSTEEIVARKAETRHPASSRDRRGSATPV